MPKTSDDPKKEIDFVKNYGGYKKMKVPQSITKTSDGGLRYPRVRTKCRW